MSIVKAEKCHLEDILKIEREFFTPPWSEKSFINELLAEDAHFVVRLENGDVCAFCVMRYFEDEGELMNIAVAGKWHRRGFAEELLWETINFAESKGIRKIFLEVRKSNFPAERLYTKLGFKKYFERKNYYDCPREDAVLMMREQGGY